MKPDLHAQALRDSEILEAFGRACDALVDEDSTDVAVAQAMKSCGCSRERLSEAIRRAEH